MLRRVFVLVTWITGFNETISTPTAFARGGVNIEIKEAGGFEELVSPGPLLERKLLISLDKGTIQGRSILKRVPSGKDCMIFFEAQER